MKVIFFENNILLYLFAYLILPGALLFSIRKLKNNRISQSNYFGKSQTDVLKGFSVLLIYVHHFSLMMTSPKFMVPFIYVGYLGVAMFLFLSGYGLMYSYLNKNNYLKGFLRKRIGRVYVPTVLSNIFLGVVGVVFAYKNYSVTDILSTSLLLQNVTNGDAFWYVNAIIIFYLYFYLALKFLKPANAIKLMFVFAMLYIGACMFKNSGIWWYNTAFAFPIGALLAYKKNFIMEKVTTHFTKLVTLASVAFLVTFVIASLGIINKFIFDTLSALFLIGVIIVIFNKVDFKSKILVFFGGISLEFYLIHSSIFYFYYNTYESHNSISFYLLLPLVTASAYLLNSITKLIFTKKSSVQIKSHTV